LFNVFNAALNWWYSSIIYFKWRGRKLCWT